MSAVTIQKILNEHDLGTIKDRRRACEHPKPFNELGKNLSAEEIEIILELIGAR